MSEQPSVPSDVSPEQFFEQMLPMGFEANAAADPSATPRELTIQYILSGAGGGEWTVSIKDGKLVASKGRSEANVTFTVGVNDWRDAVLGQNGAALGLILPQPRPGRPDNSGRLKEIKGTLALELARDAMDPFRVEMCFNGGAAPRTLLKLKLAEWLDMQTGKLNGQEAFMQGRIKVEGDMGFLMQIAMMAM